MDMGRDGKVGVVLGRWCCRIGDGDDVCKVLPDIESQAQIHMFSENAKRTPNATLLTTIVSSFSSHPIAFHRFFEPLTFDPRPRPQASAQPSPFPSPLLPGDVPSSTLPRTTS